MEVDESSSADICRVCRCEGTPDRPLFHPCICTGSIKYIHQECLLQWLRYSKKEFCELCNHRFSFTPIYSPDMPKRLPLSIVLSGLLGTVVRAVRFWVHYTLVATAWLGLVPQTAFRIYRALFTGSVSSILSLPVIIFSTENIVSDILHGFLVVTLTLLAFIGLIWLREQIVHGGGPEWLDMDLEAAEALVPNLGVFGMGNANAANDVAAQVAARQVAPQVDEQEDEREEGEDGDDDHDDDDDDDDDHDDDDDDDDEDDDDAVAPVNDNDHLPEMPAEPEILDRGQDAGGNNNNLNNNAALNGNGIEDGQWNPMEWDRAAEELTWERLLGLDGSLMFLEHVFWVVSLNTLFILVFAFIPYHIGHYTIIGFKLKSLITGAHFEGMLTTLCGYIVIGTSLVLLHWLTSLFRLKKFSRFFGLCYVVVKVALLLVIEILAFPVICGWWLDICSLTLFDATLKDRQDSYHQTPVMSIFLHWLVGMVYVFYFASFVVLLREVLRPGVLWFLRNLNDPDFNPIQEMIHLSVARHLRRFCASLVMFGTSILVMLHLPALIIKMVVPSFLPYQASQQAESQVDELVMELLLLLVILPTIQDQYHTRRWIKNCIHAWCAAAAWMLDLRSYLFGDVPLEGGADRQHHELNGDEHQLRHGDGQGAADRDLGAAHQAFLNREGPTGFQPYNRPHFFPLKIVGLLCLMLVSWLLASLVLMLVPVWLGRQVFLLWFADSPKIYELYTASLGLYICLISIRASTLLISWLQNGWTQLSQKLLEWVVIGAKASVAVFFLMGVIPFMFGILVNVVIMSPAKIPFTQTPVFFLLQDWALGAMYTKVTIALTCIGPDWWLKSTIQRVYQDGLRGLNLGFLIPALVVPTVSMLGLCLAIPYLLVQSLLPLVTSDVAVLFITQRLIYPGLLLLVVVISGIIFQLKQCRKLYEHIKNDRYLVGRRLVNYNHSRSSTPSSTSPASATSAAAVT